MGEQLMKRSLIQATSTTTTQTVLRDLEICHTFQRIIASRVLSSLSAKAKFMTLCNNKK